MLGTPHNPATPSTDHDPGTPAGPEEQGAEVDAPWWSPDIEVNVTTGVHSGNKAVIRAVVAGSTTCKLAVADQEFEASADKDFELLMPGKKDKIKIVRGEFRGELGQLIGIGVFFFFGFCHVLHMDLEYSLLILDEEIISWPFLG
jgi:hypothetical protein